MALSNNEITIFNFFPSSTSIWKCYDGELFIELESAQEYADSIGSSEILEIIRPSDLLPLEVSEEEQLALTKRWGFLTNLFEYKGEADIAILTSLPAASESNNMWTYLITSSSNVTTKSLININVAVAVGDVIFSLNGSWRKFFDAKNIKDKEANAALSATTATTKAREASESASIAVSKANLATTKAEEAAASAAASAAPVAASLTTIATRPQSILDFAGAKMLPSYATFLRASTGSYVNVNGIIKYAKAGQPRFTHNPVTRESLGILIEEARTNSYVNSNTIYPNGTTTCVVNTTATKAPDGTNTAISVDNSAGQAGYFVTNMVTLSYGFYTRSIFVKANNSTQAKIVFEGIGGTNSAGSYVEFNAITKVWTGDLASTIEVGYETYPNGWLRPWIVCEQSATKKIGLSYYTGQYGGAYAVNNSMFVWGQQMENGTYPTSYIAASGAVATRQLDALSIPTKNFSQVEGAFILSGVMGSKTYSNQRLLALATNPIIGYLGTDFTIASYDTVSSVTDTSTLKNDTIALSYSQNARKLSANGGSVVSGGNVIGLYNNPLFVGSNGSHAAINGTIKRLTIYSRMLTDTELVKATSATISSNQSGGIPANSDLGQLAYVDATTILSVPNRQELSMDGTGASVNRNIRRPYDFSFAIVDSSGVSITSQPAVSCLANTDNALIFTAPVGKTITYSITPYFEY